MIVGPCYFNALTRVEDWRVMLTLTLGGSTNLDSPESSGWVWGWGGVDVEVVFPGFISKKILAKKLL